MHLILYNTPKKKKSIVSGQVSVVTIQCYFFRTNAVGRLR